MLGERLLTVIFKSILFNKIDRIYNRLLIGERTLNVGVSQTKPCYY